MEQLAAELVEAGADGIVTGVLTPEGSWMRRPCAHLCGGAQGSGKGRPSGGVYPAPCL